MSRAIALDPRAVSGWYNRGLLHLQQQDFAGALADLERARALDPENREVQRLLQMAGSGQRAAGGDPVGVHTGPPPGHSADADTLAARIQAELTAALSVPDSLRLGVPGAEERFRRLESAHLRDPRPDTRRLLALAYLERNLLDSLQALLAPGWNADLTAEEELLLLWADRNLGELARAEEATRRLLAGGPGSGNPYALALAADMMRTSVDPVGTDAAAPNTHGYFGWWRDARMNYAADPRWGGTRIVGYAVDLFRQYRQDPLFEQAVWGLPATPTAGVTTGVGSDPRGAR